jgi:toxin ParE1/3/4
VKPVEFQPEATQDAFDAQDYYESLRPGLGDDFRCELQAALDRIRENPRLYGFESKTIRVAPVHRFPYCVYYEELNDRLWIAAVGHNSRRPGYWKRRRRN